MKILIVDDVEDARVFLTDLFESLGYEVFVAVNGSDAIQLISTKEPFIIISDIMMPVMDGFVMCRLLKNDPKLCHIPVIFYTATYTSEKDRQLAMDLGASLFLIKPMDPEELISEINVVIKETKNKKDKTHDRSKKNAEELENKYSIVLRNKLEHKINKLELAQAEVERTKTYLNSIIESMPSIIITLDKENRITHWNKTAARLIGVTLENALGFELENINPDFAVLSKSVTSVWAKNQSVVLQRIVFNSIKEKIFNISLFPLLTDKKEAFGIAIRFDDITEIETIEQQLIQSQKMELIGRLASGLAHDFNNVLTGIIGTASLIEFNCDSGQLDMDGLKKDLQMINHSGLRAAGLVKQLLTLSRKNQLNMTEVDLNQCIRNVVDICRNSFDKSITISVEIPQTSSIVNADSTQIEQVLLNLCVNALQAMTLMVSNNKKRGGTLHIYVKELILNADNQSKYPEVNQGNYYAIAIKDSGVGIPKEIIHRIYEPFFTSKKEESGTGLGLSIVYNLVKQHSGFLTVDSTIGKGTIFTVILPKIARAEISELIEEPADLMYSGSGIILVIDDEKIVLDLADRILSKIGFSIIKANSAAEGLKIYKKKKNDIDLVLLDVSMPVISGKEVFSKLKEINSSCKIIMISGYSHDSHIQEIIKLGADSFIQKPLSMKNIIEQLKKVL